MFQLYQENVKTGLWQLEQIVRVLTCKLDTKEELCDPTVNMECAYKLYSTNQRRFDRPW
jgi:hypothetical protein